MGGKKPASIGVHLSDVRKLQVARFAEHEGFNSSSEFIHHLIEKYIESKKHEFNVLRLLLEVDSSLGSMSSLNEID